MNVKMKITPIDNSEDNEWSDFIESETLKLISKKFETKRVIGPGDFSPSIEISLNTKNLNDLLNLMLNKKY